MSDKGKRKSRKLLDTTAAITIIGTVIVLSGILLNATMMHAYMPTIDDLPPCYWQHQPDIDAALTQAIGIDGVILENFGDELQCVRYTTASPQHIGVITLPQHADLEAVLARTMNALAAQDMQPPAEIELRQVAGNDYTIYRVEMN